MTDRLPTAARILREHIGDRLRTGFPLAPLTTFRIGGPAALYLEPEDDSDFVAVGHALRETGIPWVVIGKGSNILVADDGYPGLVIRLGRAFRWAARDGDRVHGGGAMPLPAMSNVALAHGLSGLEFGVAIPATVGGAVRMNAGAHDHSMDEAVESIDLVVLPDVERSTIPAAAAGFRYRHSSLPDGSVVVGVTVKLGPGEPGKIRARMDEARAWRRATQPLAEPNCGSVFTNPEGDHAARLVESAGAKGLAVGAARVSEKHANFIVADPGATAADVRGLIAEVRRRVVDRFGVELETEVRFVGDFEDRPA